MAHFRIALAAMVLVGSMAQAQQPSGHPNTPDAVDTTGWFADPDHYTQTDGAVIFSALCAGCHMPDGSGAIGAGAYPALAGNENLISADYPIYVILHGQKGMPVLGDMLDDEQVAAVVNYIRTNLGNDYTDEPATAERVKEAR